MFVYDVLINELKEVSEWKEIRSMLNVRDKHITEISAGCWFVKKFNVAIFEKLPSSREKKNMHEYVQLEKEIWKDVCGSAGRYQVSSYGRIKRVAKKRTSYLLPYRSGDKKELFIKVCMNDVYRARRVKDVVATNFLRPKRPGEVLFHANGILTDDSVGNLQWIDRVKLGKKTGGTSKCKAVIHIDADTLEVINEYRSVRAAARATPYSYQAISDYCNCKYKNIYGDLFIWADEKLDEKELLNRRGIIENCG